MLMQDARMQRPVISIAPGTELNFGPSEDSDSVVVQEGVDATRVGTAPGALVVTIAGEDQELYFHQPERAG